MEKDSEVLSGSLGRNAVVRKQNLLWVWGGGIDAQTSLHLTLHVESGFLPGN